MHLAFSWVWSRLKSPFYRIQWSCFILFGVWPKQQKATDSDGWRVCMHRASNIPSSGRNAVLFWLFTASKPEGQNVKVGTDPVEMRWNIHEVCRCIRSGPLFKAVTLSPKYVSVCKSYLQQMWRTGGNMWFVCWSVFMYTQRTPCLDLCLDPQLLRKHLLVTYSLSHTESLVLHMKAQ